MSFSTSSSFTGSTSVGAQHSIDVATFTCLAFQGGKFLSFAMM